MGTPELADARAIGLALPSARRRLNTLTSLRWFAASLVFLKHIDPLFIGTSAEHAVRVAGRAGASGVSFFFILSGFVLAWSHRGPVARRAFYRRRVARIGPSYWLVCLISVPLVWFVSSTPRQDLAGSLWAFTGLQAWIPDRSVYFGGDGVLWSLSAEAFFYLLFPWLAPVILNASTRTKKRLLVALLAISIVVPLLVRSPFDGAGTGFWAIYIFPVYRLPEFLIGICLCGLLRDGVRIPIRLGPAVVIAIVGYLAASAMPLYALWVATTIIPYALLIFAAAQNDISERPSTWLGGSFLVKLGEWSFAFYLVHQLVIRLAARVITADFASRVSGAVVISLGCYLAALGVSVLLFRFVEVPCERYLRAPRGVHART